MMPITTRGPGAAFATSFDSILERLMPSWTEAGERVPTFPVHAPAVDLWETDSAYHAALLAPGLAADSIQVTIEDGRVTVAAERTVPAIEGARAIWTEFGPVSYQRTFRLAAKLEVNQVQATYQDGVLRLLLPKNPEAQPRRISIQTTDAPKP